MITIQLPIWFVWLTGLFILVILIKNANKAAMYGIVWRMNRNKFNKSEAEAADDKSIK